MQKPLIIFDKNSNVADLVFQDPKGHGKSIERNELWCINEQDGKVLPYTRACTLITVSEKDKWYEAYADFGNSVKTEKQKIQEKAEGDSRYRDNACGIALSRNSLRGNDKAAAGTDKTNVLPDSDILGKLVLLIAERQKEMPEGSYTTHLFSSGPDKIRKKTGEEAVELLLAKGRDETVYETADLIYHIMVLFRSLDMDFNDVFRELKNRHS